MSFRRNLPAAAETRQVQSRMLLKINERDRAIAVGTFPDSFLRSGPIAENRSVLILCRIISRWGDNTEESEGVRRPGPVL